MSDTFKEIKGKTKQELQKMLIEERELLRELKFKDANRQLRNVRQIRDVKRKIARIMTALNQQKNEQSKQ